MTSKSRLSLIIFFIFVLYVFDAFTNSYIVLRENYENRLIKELVIVINLAMDFIKKSLINLKKILMKI